MHKVVLILLCILVFMVPWELMTLFPGFGTLIFAIGVLTLSVALFAVLVAGGIRMPPRPFYLLVAFVVWGFCSMLWSADPEATQTRAITYLSLIAMAWLVWEFAPGIKDQHWIMWVYMAGCGFSLAMLYFSYLSGRDAAGLQEDRFTGGGQNANFIAALLDYGVPIMVYFAMRPEGRFKKLRHLFWLYLPAAFFGVLMTGSRGGLAGYAVGAVLSMGTLLLNLRRGGGLMALVLFAAVTVAGAYYGPRFLSESSAKRLSQGLESHSMDVRKELWQKGWNAFLDNPLLGVGTGAFIGGIASQGGHANVAHNTFISVLVENGLVGFSLMLLVWLSLAYRAWRMPRPEMCLWLSLLAVWGMSSMSGSWEYNKSTWLIYGLIMAQSAALQRSAWPRMVVPQGWLPGGRPRWAPNH